MCGIAGLIGIRLATDARERCERMVDAIRHRGPDGRGVVTRPGIAFGHARLAILDLSPAASQPMASADGTLLIVFNGEIYNHEALRRALRAGGAALRTQSDTEVLLAAYQAWGESFVEHLNGIFAFALYDGRLGRVLLARDRLGVKPLYWQPGQPTLAFASEIKALAAAQGCAPQADTAALREYLVFQNHLGMRTLFQGIELFPPATVAVVDVEDANLRLRRYWQARVRPLQASRDELRERLSQTLQQAVRRQVQADVPVNAFLSGGIDSGALAALATQAGGRLQTFTCGFGLQHATAAEQGFDERPLAEQVAARLGSEHYEAVLHADDFLARMHDWAWHAEEPRVGSSFPNFCVAHLASRFTKVCLSGTGGDELFAGYPWRYQAALQARDLDSFIRDYHGYWRRMLSAADHEALTQGLPGARDQGFDAFDQHLRGALARVEGSQAPFADASLLFEAETFLHGLLVAEDKASMAHGLEVRVPLLDNEMLELALATPLAFKLGVPQGTAGAVSAAGVGGLPLPPDLACAGAAPHANGKQILREVLAPHVPPGVATARKQGFSPPFESWFRQGLRGWIESEVLGKASPLADLLHRPTALRLWQEHLHGAANHRLLLWGLVALHLSLASFRTRCR